MEDKLDDDEYSKLMDIVFEDNNQKEEQDIEHERVKRRQTEDAKYKNPLS